MFLGKPYDPQAVDVWSLGVILYVLVCGTLPFDAPTLPALKKRVLSCRFRIPFSMSTDCETLIRRMLVREPSRRLRLSEIDEQKWMELRKDDATQLNDLATNRQRYHDQTIRLMRSLGINTAKAIESVRLDTYDHYMAIYLLLCERCRQQTKPQAKSTEVTLPVELRTQATALQSEAGSAEEAAAAAADRLMFNLSDQSETAKDVNNVNFQLPKESPNCVNSNSEQGEREDTVKKLDKEDGLPSDAPNTTEQPLMPDQPLNRTQISLLPLPAQSPTTRSPADSLLRYSMDEGIMIDESDRVSRNMHLSNSYASCMSTDKPEDSLIQQSVIASSQLSALDASEYSQETSSLWQSSISPSNDPAPLERLLTAVNPNVDNSDSDERTVAEGSERASTPKFLLGASDSPALSTIGSGASSSRVDPPTLCNQVPCATDVQSSDLLKTDVQNSYEAQSEANELPAVAELSNEDTHNAFSSDATTSSDTLQMQGSYHPLQINLLDSFTSDSLTTDESDFVSPTSPRVDSKLNNPSQAPPRRQRMSVPLLPSKRIVSKKISNADPIANDTGFLNPAQSLPSQPTTAATNLESKSIKPPPFTSPLRVDELSRPVPRFISQNEQSLVPFLRTPDIQNSGGGFVPRICTPLRR